MGCDAKVKNTLIPTYLLHPDFIFPVQLLPSEILGPGTKRENHKSQILKLYFSLIGNT